MVEKSVRALLDKTRMKALYLKMRFAGLSFSVTVSFCGTLGQGGMMDDRRTHHGKSIKSSGKDTNEVLPREHRVAALVKRWLMGTHQGSFEKNTCRLIWTNLRSGSIAAHFFAA